MNLTATQYRDICAKLGKNTPADAHLTVVRWFSLVGTAPRLHVVEHRATFYRDCVRWEDHPWGKEDVPPRKGADFVNHWTHEALYVGVDADQSWRAQGRSGDGWWALANYFTWEPQPQVFDTVQKAMAERILHLNRGLGHAEDTVREYKEAIANAMKDFQISSMK